MGKSLVKMLIGIAVVIGCVFVAFHYRYFPKPNTIDQISESSTYKACGCGCCPDVVPAEQCLYKKDGDDLEIIKQEDVALSKSSSCALMGCSAGTLYKYCD